MTHAQLKQFDQAEHALRVTLRLKPGGAETQRVLAQVQLQRGNQTGAADPLGEWVAAEPDSAAAWELLGHAEFQRNRLGEAEAAWRRALALDPALAGVWASLGTLQMKLGRLEDAEASLKQAVRLRPEQSDAWRDQRGQAHIIPDIRHHNPNSPCPASCALDSSRCTHGLPRGLASRFCPIVLKGPGSHCSHNSASQPQFALPRITRRGFIAPEFIVSLAPLIGAASGCACPDTRS